MKRTVLERLEDMLHYAADAEAFAEGKTLDELKQDRKTSFALIYTIEVVGEAAKFIPEEIRTQHPHIFWKGISGMRDRLAHGYYDIDYDLLWETLHNDIPDLIAALELVIKDLSTQ
jgi:uncharacterized protein with HEPN domain